MSTSVYLSAVKNLAEQAVAIGITIETMKRDMILAALAQSEGNIAVAARVLGVSRRTVERGRGVRVQ